MTDKLEDKLRKIMREKGGEVTSHEIAFSVDESVKTVSQGMRKIGAKKRLVNGVARWSLK